MNPLNLVNLLNPLNRPHVRERLHHRLVDLLDPGDAMVAHARQAVLAHQVAFVSRPLQLAEELPVVDRAAD